MKQLTNKDRLESLGGTVTELCVNGITYYACGYRSDGTVDVYDINMEKVASADFDSECEQAHLNVDGEESASSDIYFNHHAKTEYDLAFDVGTYLAALL